MSIEWSPSLATGLEWQDRQHKELFRRINSLLEAMDVGRGKGEVGKLFKFLDEYFVVHFDAEEKAMHSSGYPGALKHIEEHARFIEEISRLQEEFGKGPSTGLVIKTQRKVVDWLINHIGEVDREFAAFAIRAEAERKGKI